MQKHLFENITVYDQQMRDAESMGYTNRELIEEKDRLYKEYKWKIEQMSIDYNEAKTETQKEMEDLRKKYNEQIEDLKEQMKNKSNEIQDLYKDNFFKGWAYWGASGRIENCQG